MSWVRIWVHLVFSTKNREQTLRNQDVRTQLYEHIRNNASKKEIWLDSINGHSEHIHCLVSLGKDQTISKIAQLIKGESSFWINKQGIIHEKFVWQDDYWAVGVSENHLERVREYIRRQEEHHRVKPFAEEVAEFMEKYGWNLIADNPGKPE